MKNQRDPVKHSAVAETLIACENDTWSLIQRKDWQGFANYLAEDFYDIFPDGTERTKAELVDFLSTAELKEYRLTNFRVTLLNPDAAIVTYQVDARAVIQGSEVAMHNSVTAGWATRDGRWLNVSAVATTRSGRNSKQQA